MAQKAVLFDMDGVVIDNLPYHVDAWLLYCERHGIHLTREIFYKDLNGLNSKDTFEWLLKREISKEGLVNHNIWVKIMNNFRTYSGN